MTIRPEWEFTELAGPYELTEGPAWDGEALLFTHIPGSRILRYHPQTGEIKVYRSETHHANGLMFDKNGQLYACEAGGRCIARYDPDGSREVIADSFEGKRLNSPNDLAIDARGRIWFTDPVYGKPWTELIGEPQLDHNSVYRIDPEPNDGWSIHRATYDTTKPNGILVSVDQKTLYVAQSNYDGDRELRSYPIQADGSLGQYEVLHNFYPHRGIDGMCLDVNGNIVATAGWEKSGPGGMIYVFTPAGRVLETHPLPCERPTNCSWAGDLQTLYVTSVCGRLFCTHTHLQGWLLYP